MAYFDTPAEAYVRFMGRFSSPLAGSFADFGLGGVAPGARVLDVGCGPGMLTAELVRRHGAANVTAVDPMPAFVQATASAYPEVETRVASAEDLPFGDSTFGATLAQLVVHFMTDPAAGVREMARVTAPGGRVAACVWDHGGDSGPLSGFWSAVTRLDPGAETESGLTGSRQGQIVHLLEQAGLRDVVEDRLTVTVEFPTFEDWWTPFTAGVGPAGQYVARLDDAGRERLVAALREEYGDGEPERPGPRLRSAARMDPRPAGTGRP